MHAQYLEDECIRLGLLSKPVVFTIDMYLQTLRLIAVCRCHMKTALMNRALADYRAGGAPESPWLS